MGEEFRPTKLEPAYAGGKIGVRVTGFLTAVEQRSPTHVEF